MNDNMHFVHSYPEDKKYSSGNIDVGWWCEIIKSEAIIAQCE